METPALPEAPVYLQVIEVGLILLGIATLIRWQFLRRTADSRRSRLKHWPLPVTELVVGFVLVLFSTFLFQSVGLFFQRRFADSFSSSHWILIHGAFLHAGLLVGIVSACLRWRPVVVKWEPDTPPLPEPPAPPPELPVPVLAAGVITFLASLPIVSAVSFFWTLLLERLGKATDQQALIDIFRNTESTPVLVGLSVLAVVVAPLTEEPIFRGGLFRFLRTRVPARFAYLVPSVLFGLLHANLLALIPLIVLGMILSAAYERTGRIAVPIIAHGLFNLHTLLLLLGGWQT